MIMTKISNKEIINTDKNYYLQVFNRYPIALKKGKGSYVWDWDGKKYLDVLAGIAVNSIGHAHPKLVKAIQKQAEKLIHISNFYVSKPQAELAERLCILTGMDRAFLGNSGVEAVEGAIKIARKYAYSKGKSGNIVSMEGCFHGRTLATIATGKEKGKIGFEPIPTGFTKIPFNDIEKLDNATSNDTIAIISEPIQGEGGVNISTKHYLEAVRKLCNEKDIVLIFDEIQCGLGRTGRFLGSEHSGVKADIITLAKALGGGFPISAVLCKQKIADSMSFGDHGTTFGGNPLACAAAMATLNVIFEENLLKEAEEKGEMAFKLLNNIASKENHIKQIRGAGLMIGIELDFPGKKLVEKMIKKGVLANVTADTIIRFVPALNISKKDLKYAISVFYESFKEVKPS